MDPEDNPESADTHSSENTVDELADTILDLLEKVFRLYVSSSSSTDSPPGKTVEMNDRTDENGSLVDDFYEELLDQIDQLDGQELQQLKQAVNGSGAGPEPGDPDPPSPSPSSADADIEELREQARAEGFEEGYDRGTQDALIQVKDKLEEHYLSYSLNLFLFGEAEFDLNLDPDRPKDPEEDEPESGDDS